MVVLLSELHLLEFYVGYVSESNLKGTRLLPISVLWDQSMVFQIAWTSPRA